MTDNRALDDPLVVVAAIRRAQERVLRAGTGSALDMHVLGLLDSHLQTFLEEAPGIPREAAERCLRSLYRHQSAHCAEHTLLQFSLPRPWAVADGLYLVGVEPLDRMTVVHVKDLPGQHQLTDRCSNADLHTSLLRDHQKHQSQAHPNWTFEQVDAAARQSATEQWAILLRSGNVAPCSRHSSTKEQFEKAVDLACRITETQDEDLRQDTIIHHPDPAVRSLVFDFFQDPIFVTGQGEIGGGQNRLCAARQYEITRLPVLTRPYAP